MAAEAKLDVRRVRSAIQAAERGSSGHIAVKMVRDQTVDDAVARAERAFARHALHRTSERNGILILVAPRARRFAVYGDRGIHERLGEAFWNQVAADMSERFAGEGVEPALLYGIDRFGSALREHFPEPSAS